MNSLLLPHYFDQSSSGQSEIILMHGKLHYLLPNTLRIPVYSAPHLSSAVCRYGVRFLQQQFRKSSDLLVVDDACLLPADGVFVVPGMLYNS